MNRLYSFIEDPALVLERLGGNSSLLERMLDKFSTHYRGARQEFNKLAAARDTEECRRFVHSLKGVSANLGMDVLYRLCVPLEAAIRDSGLESTADAVESFLREIEAIILEIDRERQ